MPYQRSYRKKRPARSGPFVRFQKKDSTAIKALKMAYNVRQLINVEFKESNTQVDENVGTGWSLQLLNGLQKGTDNTNRVGDSIKVKSIEVKSGAYLTSSFSGLYQRVRRIIFIDLQPNAGTPSQSALLENALSDWTYAFKNLDNKKRFVILKDDVVTMSPNTNAAISFPDYYYKMNMHTAYDSSNVGDVTDISTNAIYIAFMSNSASGAQDPSVLSNQRIRYIDN